MINKLREAINETDYEMQKLFKKRLDLVAKVKSYKQQNNLPIFDGKREEELIQLLKESYNDDATWYYYEKFIRNILSISKEYQNE